MRVDVGHEMSQDCMCDWFLRAAECMLELLVLMTGVAASLNQQIVFTPW